MKIDHVFASGAVVGYATMHSWGHPSLCCTWSNGRPHSCLVAHPTTTPDANTWPIPTVYHWFKQWLVACWTNNNYLNQWWPIVSQTLMHSCSKILIKVQTLSFMELQLQMLTAKFAILSGANESSKKASKDIVYYLYSYYMYQNHMDCITGNSTN